MPSLSSILGLAAALVASASAHTEIFYPQWRGDSFLPPFDQQIYPCAGINDNKTTPRTPWPLTGGSLNVTLHDAAAYIWVNLGLGVNTTNFNYTIVQGPLNETGAGDLCFPHIPLPEGMPIEDGTPATIQFATAGTDGEGLYNCADITFSKNATLLPKDQCLNSSITVVPLMNSVPGMSMGSSTTTAAPSSTTTTAGAAMLAPPLALFLVSIGFALGV